MENQLDPKSTGCNHPPVAHRLEWLSYKQLVGGSIPPRRIYR